MNKYCNNSDVYESTCIPKTVNASIAVLTPNAYIGVFGQQCRSSTGHFCNEIF